jgi:hypothetical protein
MESSEKELNKLRILSELFSTRGLLEEIIFSDMLHELVFNNSAKELSVVGIYGFVEVSMESWKVDCKLF